MYDYGHHLSYLASLFYMPFEHIPYHVGSYRGHQLFSLLTCDYNFVASTAKHVAVSYLGSTARQPTLPSAYRFGRAFRTPCRIPSFALDDRAISGEKRPSKSNAKKYYLLICYEKKYY